MRALDIAAVPGGPLGTARSPEKVLMLLEEVDAAERVLVTDSWSGEFICELALAEVNRERAWSIISMLLTY